MLMTVIFSRMYASILTFNLPISDFFLKKISKNFSIAISFQNWEEISVLLTS